MGARLSDLLHARKPPPVGVTVCVLQVTNSQAFAWLSQLRHRWDDKTRHCYVNICDAQFQFSYEYLGNTNRLVITPLTDRYICVKTVFCKMCALTGEVWHVAPSLNR